MQNTRRALLGAFLAAGLTMGASGALVTVTTNETWDGTSNPHAADGVTLSGSGTQADPAVYSIPNGMTITATGAIWLTPTNSVANNSVKFNITGGDLAMSAGATIYTRSADRQMSDIQNFVLDLGGTGSITGAGRIIGWVLHDDMPRILTIQNVNNVSLTNIDCHTENVNGSGRPMSITANGAVVATGTIDNSDRDDGGDGGQNVTIQANSITVNNISTYGSRTDRGQNGAVVLQALAAPGYNLSDGANNKAANKLTVTGTIQAVGANPYGGDVTMQGVVVQFNPGFQLFQPAGGTRAVDVGVLQGGATQAAVFADYSVGGSGITPANDVQWSGTAPQPPPGSPPSFTVKPMYRANAAQDQQYSSIAATLAGSATDPDANPLSYAKVFGPAWLVVATNGALSGIPTIADGGSNTWTVSVTDGTRFDTAILNIFVAASARWNAGNTVKPNATQDVFYADSLVTNVTYSGSNPLTFAKVSGPAWLTVASNGNISGTPSSSDVLIGTYNQWVVSVADGLFTNNTNLRITVNGSPKFTANPAVYPNDVVGLDYSGTGLTLASVALDPQGLALTFSKVSGPAWLSVGSDGTLSGTPAAGDLGTNTWIVSANDGTFPATHATLIIIVRSPGNAIVNVVSAETWDGVANPHAADGVTLYAGLGTEADPKIYTIPAGMHIASTGGIYTGPTGNAIDNSIEFVIQGGNLAIDGGGFLNLGRSRNDRQVFILDLGVTNSVTGAGNIIGLKASNESPRVLFITNVMNVAFNNIDLHVSNANNNGRHMFITAGGAVVVTGTIDNTDRDTGGDNAGNVTIQAASIAVNNIDTHAVRSSATRGISGSVLLQALAAPGYSTSDAANNKFTDRLTVSGTITATDAVADPGGSVTLQGVAVQLDPGFQVLKTASAVFTLNAGVVQSPATALDLFVNHVAGSSLTPAYNVQWSGNIIPTLRFGAAPPGQLSLNWGGTGYTLQTNSNLANPSGWGNVPGAASPTTFTIQPGKLFYRLKQ